MRPAPVIPSYKTERVTKGYTIILRLNISIGVAQLLIKCIYKALLNIVELLWMGRIRRGGYLIEWWIGDHSPKHVHVYKNGRLIAKVEVLSQLVLTGKVDRRLNKILTELVKDKEI
ncbi:MAG: DUF4160 domain-containing protein [Bdellovibrionales bacterium]